MKDICRESDRCLLLLRMYVCGNNHHGFLISCAESWKRSERDMGDQIVIDWKEEAEKTYGFQVNTLRRGRGSWILETDQGLRLLKEYRGSVNRLEFEEAVLQSLDGMETVKADQYVRNSAGRSFSSSAGGWRDRYIVKQWYADRECDLKDEEAAPLGGPGAGAPAPAVSRSKEAG